ncbi:MAG: nuclear transport factor 2 family protein [Planctomycetales bacterium]|nr:nuclear transport factor 2 family protein [Planctomycetales bacterium]
MQAETKVYLDVAIRVAVAILVPAFLPTAMCQEPLPVVEAIDDKLAIEQIKRLYDKEHENLLRMDISAQAKFLPDDFVVTNPFGMFIDKQQVVKRLHDNIIKYSRYERTFDAFRRHDDTMIVIGSETVVPTRDANRPDAGKIVHRRFTEVWLRREGGWQKIVRHASDNPSGN